MITEDYVNFEVAKLLKEKGFNEEIETIISPDGKIYHCDERSVFKIPHKTIKNSDINIYIDDCSCPTIQMTMKWLREVHNIFIQVDYIWSPKELYTYTFDIHNMKRARSIFSTPYGESFNFYEEACEAAIKYCLTNLI